VNRLNIFLKTVLPAALCLILFSPVQAFADDKPYRMMEKDGDFVVTLKDHPGLKLDLLLEGGVPEVLAFSPSHVRPDVYLLIYYAGSAGTSNMAVVYRAFVIDVKHSKVLGEAPWKIDGHPSYGFDQPQWVWTPDSINISGPDLNSLTIPLPKPVEDGKKKKCLRKLN